MNGFFCVTASVSARCAASSPPVGLKKSNLISRPHVLKSWAYTAGRVDHVLLQRSRLARGTVECLRRRPRHRRGGSLLLGVGTTTTTLIASSVIPTAVAPPLFSPFLYGRTHGGRVE